MERILWYTLTAVTFPSCPLAYCVHSRGRASCKLKPCQANTDVPRNHATHCTEHDMRYMIMSQGITRQGIVPTLTNGGLHLANLKLGPYMTTNPRPPAKLYIGYDTSQPCGNSGNSHYLPLSYLHSFLQTYTHSACALGALGNIYLSLTRQDATFRSTNSC